MGFFSDLKDDLSQAVNELMPEEGAEEILRDVGWQDAAEQEATDEKETVNGFNEDLSQMLDKVEEEMEMDVKKDMEVEIPQEKPAYTSAAEEKWTDLSMHSSKRPSDEVSVFTESMIVNGNIATEGALDIRGSIVGNIEALGKLNITGAIQGG